MRTLAIAAFSFSAAVFCCVLLLPEALWIPAGLSVCVLFAAALAVRRGKGSRRRKTVLLMLGGLAAGALWSGLYSEVFFQPLRELDDRTVRLTGETADYPRQTEYGWSVAVLADTPCPVRTYAVLYGDEQLQALRPGDRISTVAHCTLGDRTFAGEEVSYYTAKGIFLRGIAYRRLEVERPDRIPMRWWAAVLSERLKGSIDAAFPEEEAALIRGVVTGSRDSLTDRYTAALQRTGLSHTVAVSGMHLAFLAGMLSLLMGKGRRSTAAVTVAAVILFCGVAGNTPSVLRAAVMILLLQLAPLLERERDDITALGTALLFLLLGNPLSAAHVGLQLSFAAVAGILLFAQGIQDRTLKMLGLDMRTGNPLLQILLGIPKAGIAALSATLGASVTTIPLVAVHFGYLSLIAPLSNLLALWAVALTFLGGLGVGVLGLACPAAAAALAVPFGWVAQYLLRVVDVLGRIPFSAISLEGWCYRAWLGYLFLLLGWTAVQREGRRPGLPICCGIVTLVLVLVLNAVSVPTGELEATVLDVGQGQSVLLRLGRSTVLVDCGGDGSKDPGDAAADYIQSLGGNRLDLLVVSHFHEDHANGVEELLKRVEVTEIAVPDVQEGDELRRNILELAEKRGTRVRLIGEKTEYTFPGGQVCQLYAPVETDGKTNEQGLVILASAGSFDVLLTGDMGGEQEELLLKRESLPDVELLIVGHHGSKYSTTEKFLRSVRPEVAVISVGKNNRYGHPAPETLERLENAGAEVRRTDRNGTVTVRSGNQKER